MLRFDLEPLKPILLVDMDGVIANYYDYFSQLWAINHPNRPLLKPEELTHMYFEKCYPEEHISDIRHLTTRIGFFENLPEIEGAAKTLNKIMDEGKFHVFLCSTPDSDSEDLSCSSEKMRWIERVLGKRWLKKVILAHDKTLAFGNFLIDDKPDITGVNPYPEWEHVVFTHNYNKDLAGPRLDSWAHWDQLEPQLLKQWYGK